MDGEAKFSILERYGENYTAKEYITNPAIGRDEEIKELLLILLTPEKSAILVGKPGIGKTAIVEGLAYAIQRKEVPEALQGYTIINIKTASLLGTMPSGESKVQMMIDELKEKEKIILFIDEIHMLIGATDESSLDFANIFKEGLGRGSIKVVGATTTEEYERYILRDKAFARRFQKVDVAEPTRDETVKIMVGTLPKIEKTTGVRLKYSKYQQEMLMGFLVDITSEYKRVFEIGSRYPDIALTLLKSAFSFAVFDNRTEVNIYDFEKAIENTHVVYPDVIKKELPLFKEKFKDMYDEEKGIFKEGIAVPSSYQQPVLERPSNDLNANIITDYPAPNRGKESLFATSNTITGMGTRDNRLAPEKISNDQYDNVLLNGTIAQPVESNVVTVNDEQEPTIQTPPEQSADKNYDGVLPTDDGMYGRQMRIMPMGRDNLQVPQREKSTAIDGVLTNNPDMRRANTNLNLDLTIDESFDDVDNEDDDFYEKDEDQ